MNPIHCIHMRNDGGYCQSPPQTGKSYCFSHDPEQEEKRAAAQRNGGLMRPRGPQPEPNPLAALNLAPVEVNSIKDVRPIMVEALNLYRQARIDKAALHAKIATCHVLVAIFREERLTEQQAQREARLAAEAARASLGAPATSDAALAAGFCQGTDLSVPKGLKREERYHPAGGPREAQRSETKERPIILDASKPIDWSQFKGKKPRITGIIPLFRNIVTGELFDPDGLVQEQLRSAGACPSEPRSPREDRCQGTTSPIAERLGGQEDKYQGTDSSVPKGTEEEDLLAAAGTREDKYQGTTLVVPKGTEKDEFNSAEGPRGAKRSAIENDVPRTHKLSQYSVEPETPAPPKPKPQPKTDRSHLHPMIQYWGLH